MPKGVKGKPSAVCHPELPYYAKGLCKLCYEKNRDPEKRRARSHRFYGNKCKAREHQWRSRYNLTSDEVKALLGRQNFRCPVCLNPLSTEELAIDHDHSCCPGKKSCGKCVRGVVHRACNSSILGMLEKRRQELQNAEVYLATTRVSGTRISINAKLATSDAPLLEAVLENAGIDSKNCEDILAYMRILRLRHEPTYLHSIRVGLLAEKIAACSQEPGITPKMLLWAGLLHDIGKILVPSEVLDKTSKFSNEDFSTMEPHVRHGWTMLATHHDYTAAIIVRHHQFGPKPYPAELPPLPEYLNGRGPTVHRAARLLALADYYDALTHRNNDKFGGTVTDSAQKHAQYLRDNADETPLIERLITAGYLKF